MPTNRAILTKLQGLAAAAKAADRGIEDDGRQTPEFSAFMAGLEAAFPHLKGHQWGNAVNAITATLPSGQVIEEALEQVDLALENRDMDAEFSPLTEAEGRELQYRALATASGWDPETSEYSAEGFCQAEHLVPPLPGM